MQKPSKRSRRSHQKSHDGCANCKQRRVKCDEAKPSCTNCSRYNIRCSFLPSVDGQQPNDGLAHDLSPVASKPKGRGRPRKDWPSILNKNTYNVFGPIIVNTSSSKDAQLGHELNLSDLELLHHYSTVSCETLGGPTTFWRTRAVQTGLSHPYLLHLILCFSAMHLRRLRPNRMGHFERLCDLHFVSGIQGLYKLIDKCDTDNGQALYMASSLVCLCTCARGPLDGNWLVFAKDEKPMWLAMLKGVRAVIETAGETTVFDGFRTEDEPRDTGNCETLEERPRSDNSWETHLAQLRAWISNNNSKNPLLFSQAIDKMVPCFVEVYGARVALESDASLPVLSWLYSLQDEFVDLLQERDASALLVLGHYLVVLKTLDDIWFMQGWTKHIFFGIEQHLSGDHIEWLNWPAIEVNSLK